MNYAVNYKQGNTEVFADYDKVVVKNSTGKEHVKANVEQIFGMGEWDKLVQVKTTEESKQNPHNPYAKSYVLISTYIPSRARKDLKLKEEKSLPGINEKDLVGEYFK